MIIYLSQEKEQDIFSYLDLLLLMQNQNKSPVPSVLLMSERIHLPNVNVVSTNSLFRIATRSP